MEAEVDTVQELFLLKNLGKIFANLPAVLALLGLAVLLGAFFRLRRVALTPRLMTHIGLALALALVLQSIKLYQFPQGGSVTPGSMVPLILTGILYGPEVGALAGFLYGTVKLILSPYIFHPIQVLFDYPLPFMALGLAGFFPRRPLLAVLAALGGRFVFHFLSGVVFFASYAPPGMSPYLYSLVVNGTYLSVEALICVIILRVLPVARLTALLPTGTGRGGNWR